MSADLRLLYGNRASKLQVRVASSATGTGRVAELVDPHTPSCLPKHRK